MFLFIYIYLTNLLFIQHGPIYTAVFLIKVKLENIIQKITKPQAALLATNIIKHSFKRNLI